MAVLKKIRQTHIQKPQRWCKRLEKSVYRKKSWKSSGFACQVGNSYENQIPHRSTVFILPRYNFSAHSQLKIARIEVQPFEVERYVPTRAAYEREKTAFPQKWWRRTGWHAVHKAEKRPPCGREKVRKYGEKWSAPCGIQMVEKRESSFKKKVWESMSHNNSASCLVKNGVELASKSLKTSGQKVVWFQGLRKWIMEKFQVKNIVRAKRENN